MAYQYKHKATKLVIRGLAQECRGFCETVHHRMAFWNGVYHGLCYSKFVGCIRTRDREVMDIVNKIVDAYIRCPWVYKNAQRTRKY
jgi:hypothetical protein